MPRIRLLAATCPNCGPANVFRPTTDLYHTHTFPVLLNDDLSTRVRDGKAQCGICKAPVLVATEPA